MSSSIHAHQRRKTFIRCIRFFYVLRAGVQIRVEIKGVQYMLSYYALYTWGIMELFLGQESFAYLSQLCAILGGCLGKSPKKSREQGVLNKSLAGGGIELWPSGSRRGVRVTPLPPPRAHVWPYTFVCPFSPPPRDPLLLIPHELTEVTTLSESALRKNPLYYRLYYVYLNTLFSSLVPFVSLLYLNVFTVRALRR